jgi:hypothetical protein
MGRWQTLVVTTRESESTWRDAPVVRTLLDMITWLERASDAIATLVLGGEFARDGEIATFVRESYPSIALVCV